VALDTSWLGGVLADCCWRHLGMGEGVHRMLTRLAQIAAGGTLLPATVWIYAMILECV